MRRAMAGLTTFQTWKEHISAFELEEKCRATYGSTKIGEDGSGGALRAVPAQHEELHSGARPAVARPCGQDAQ